MRARIVACVGAVMVVVGALGPWSRIRLEPISQLEGGTIETTGISSGAGGWVLFVLGAVLTAAILILVSGAAPGVARIVVVLATIAGVWGALRVVLLARRLSDLSEPRFNSEASLSWGPWLYLAGCALAFVAAVLVARGGAGTGVRARRSSTIQRQLPDQEEESWQ